MCCNLCELEKVVWKYCIKDKCDEGYCNRCNLRNNIRPYPENGLCYENIDYELAWGIDGIEDAFDKDELEARM